MPPTLVSQLNLDQRKTLNRCPSWALVYSPLDKDDIQNNYQNLLQTLNKNTIKYIIQYEEGKQKSNPHLDIVAEFKTNQARSDLTRKFPFLGKSPAVVYSKVEDWKYRIGYNQKEMLPSPLNHCFNITEAEITESVEHYLAEEEARKVRKSKYGLFTYIKESTFAYEVNKYIINTQSEPPTTPHALHQVMRRMYYDGYIFTTIKRDSLQVIGRQIILVYKYQKDPGSILENSDINRIAETDIKIPYHLETEASNLCSACSSINFH